MIRHRVRDTALALAARLPVETTVPRAFEVLILRPDHLGDLLFVTPALRRLRAALPEARITLAVGPWARPVLAGNPDIDELITIPYPGFTRQASGHPFAPYQLLGHWAAVIRDRAPSAVVILRNDHWWGALLAQRAGVPLRIGSDDPAVRRYLTHPIATPATHWVARNATLLDATANLLGGKLDPTPVTPATAPLRPPTAPEAADTAEQLLRAHGVTGPFFVVVPGSGARVKHWPAPRWAQAATALARETGLHVVLTGSADEIPLVEEIRAGIDAPALSLAGQTDLPTLAAVFARARLVTGVDSGPLHLAVAAGTPTVHLYGPSSIDDFGPWGDPARHQAISAGLRCPRCGDLSPERPEGAGCMLALSVDQVVAAMREGLRHA